MNDSETRNLCLEPVCRRDKIVTFRTAYNALIALLVTSSFMASTAAATSSHENLVAKVVSSLEEELPMELEKLGFWRLESDLPSALDIELLREDLEIGIVQSQRFDFVNRTLLAQTLREMNLCDDVSCLFDPGNMYRLGQTSEIDALIYGEITDSSDLYPELQDADYFVTVLLRVVSTSTSAVLWSKEITGMNVDSVVDRIGKIPTEQALWREEGFADAVAGFLNSSRSIEDAGTRTVMFLDFEDRTGKYADIDLLYKALSQAVVDQTTLKLVDRSILRELLRERQLEIGDIVGSGHRGRYGRLYGVDAFIFGTIRDITPEEVGCSVRVSDVETNIDLDARIIRSGCRDPELKLVNLLRKAGPSAFRSAPNGAEVFVDGQSIGMTPTQLEYVDGQLTGKALRYQLENGIHEIRWTLYGYSDVIQTIEVRYKQAMEFYAELRPAICVLNVVSEPLGALVQIDGEDVGQTPSDPFEISAGHHRIAASRCDHFRVSEEILLKPGDSLRVDLVMEPKTRSSAALRSLLLPGLGQHHKGLTRRGILFHLATAGAASIAIYGHVDRENAIDSFKGAKAKYDNAVTQDLMDEYFNEMEQLHKEIEDAEDIRKYGLIALGAVWAANVIDALLGFPLSCHNDERMSILIGGREGVWRRANGESPCQSFGCPALESPDLARVGFRFSF